METFEVVSYNRSALSIWVRERNIPENAISGRMRRSKLSGFALERTASARFRLLSTSPTWGANCKQPMRILGGMWLRSMGASRWQRRVRHKGGGMIAT